MLQERLQSSPAPVFHESGLKALERAFRECEFRLGRPATNLEVCDELGLSLRELYALLDLHRGVGLGQIDDFESGDSDEHVGPMIKYLPDPSEGESFFVFSKPAFQAAMARALEALPKNERLVVSLHHNDNLKMHDIAEIFGISVARVAQIHTTAMVRIRGKLQSFEAD
jgi:RNA polymerase sigma factor for flagellar operon FliA